MAPVVTFVEWCHNWQMVRIKWDHLHTHTHTHVPSSQFLGYVAFYLISTCAIVIIVYVLSHFSRVWLFVTVWTVACPWGSSVHAVLQERILEWVAMPFSRESFWPRDWTRVCLRFLHWQVGSLPIGPPEKPIVIITLFKFFLSLFFDAVSLGYKNSFLLSSPHSNSNGSDWTFFTKFSKRQRQ